MPGLRTFAAGSLVAAALGGLPAVALIAAPAAVADPVARCAATPNLSLCDTVSRVHPDRPHGNFMYGPYGTTPPIGD